MSIIGEIRESLTIQVHELEALQSVYPKELIISDHGILADINSFIESPHKELPQRLEYVIQVSVDQGIIELLVSLPVNYPKEKPEVYARTCLLDRGQQLLLNEALAVYIDRQEEGEPCIYAFVSWIQDNAESYIKASKIGKKNNNIDKHKIGKEKHPSIFARYWIYSHHIYSKLKRREIVVLMKDNSLTGFCLAGKPGIICIEGIIEDCDYCWQKIKVMNWHRILVKLMEEENINDEKDINTMRKFTEFQEISFPSSERHNDMGQLLKYLTEHECQHAFKELFGVEGKLVQLAE